MKAPELLYDYDEERWLEALDWHALRCGVEGLTPAQQDAWRNWTLDAQNQKVYAACAQLHRDAQALEETPTLSRTGPIGRSGAFGRWGKGVRWTVGGSFLAACVAGMILVMHRPRPSPLRPARVLMDTTSWIYRSASAQTRRIRLIDGSRVVLGAETVLAVSITPRRRALTLERGEAWFDVVHRPHWPFVVTAGAGVIRDLGTAFVVDRESGRTEVTVTQGQVEVSLAGVALTPHLGSVVLKPVRLHRGERFVYGRRIRAAVGRVSPQLALAWTRGRLEFVNEPLGVVAENLSRYSRRPILVSPAAASLHLSTLVLSRHIRSWFRGVSRVLPVVVVRTHAAICIRLRASEQTRVDNECGDF